jgi:hypothetical protein
VNEAFAIRHKTELARQTAPPRDRRRKYRGRNERRLLTKKKTAGKMQKDKGESRQQPLVYAPVERRRPRATPIDRHTEDRRAVTDSLVVLTHRSLEHRDDVSNLLRGRHVPRLDCFI